MSSTSPQSAGKTSWTGGEKSHDGRIEPLPGDPGLAVRLRSLLDRADVTGVEVAMRSGVSRQQVSDVRGARRACRIATLEAIARAISELEPTVGTYEELLAELVVDGTCIAPSNPKYGDQESRRRVLLESQRRPLDEVAAYRAARRGRERLAAERRAVQEAEEARRVAEVFAKVAAEEAMVDPPSKIGDWA